MAEELIAKESINLVDIVRILGDRPFPLRENVREYLEELKDRKQKEDVKDDKDKHDKEEAASTPDDQSHPPSTGTG